MIDIVVKLFPGELVFHADIEELERESKSSGSDKLSLGEDDKVYVALVQLLDALSLKDFNEFTVFSLHSC